MKKTLLSLCLFVAVAAGQAFASNAVASQEPAFTADNILDNNLKGNKRFTVQVSTGEGGQIEISGTGAVSKNSVASAQILTGENVELVITADEGYELKTLYVDGSEVTADVVEGVYTINAISKNISVSATFEVKEEPTVAGDVNEDGSINAADVVAIYNFITEGAASGVKEALADVNKDQAVSAADVVQVYNIISGAN